MHAKGAQTLLELVWIQWLAHGMMCVGPPTASKLMLVTAGAFDFDEG